MLTEYLKAALQQATYKLLDDGEGYFGEIPGFQGLWATSATLEACRIELEEALEEWILLGLKLGHPLPEIEGVVLDFTKVEVA
jgi:predicted RNase H-like HicB family nuclease